MGMSGISFCLSCVALLHTMLLSPFLVLCTACKEKKIQKNLREPKFVPLSSRLTVSLGARESKQNTITHASKLPHENEYLHHRGFACFSHPRGTSVCWLKPRPSYLRLLRACTREEPRPAAGRRWRVPSFFIGSVLPHRNSGGRQIHKTIV